MKACLWCKCKEEGEDVVIDFAEKDEAGGEDEEMSEKEPQAECWSALLGRLFRRCESSIANQLVELIRERVKKGVTKGRGIGEIPKKVLQEVFRIYDEESPHSQPSFFGLLDLIEKNMIDEIYEDLRKEIGEASCVLLGGVCLPERLPLIKWLRPIRVCVNIWLSLDKKWYAIEEGRALAFRLGHSCPSCSVRMQDTSEKRWQNIEYVKELQRRGGKKYVEHSDESHPSVVPFKKEVERGERDARATWNQWRRGTEWLSRFQCLKRSRQTALKAIIRRLRGGSGAFAGSQAVVLSGIDVAAIGCLTTVQAAAMNVNVLNASLREQISESADLWAKEKYIEEREAKIAGVEWLAKADAFLLDRLRIVLRWRDFTGEGVKAIVQWEF
uniref:Uncharacterized protein n=1 Tax=Chromera velia CCMP2878 TaxID=1169474 RepID=A0A0G4HSP6_9ALVE|eukprot:Cvel_31110.t1-p1 / transcript=Cvel_31110.t1 / gene=Cvel_31110 / organism=Chromera_velia_CCMP2878 / gene_product=hypothetical protein / transcript_product=hypothetical protein / location=Cvel_scaffold4568:1709-3869(+) / protein_length=384 / sequence_SO=supercontig / SO=protein_coding / is_pseudo=false